MALKTFTSELTASLKPRINFALITETGKAQSTQYRSWKACLSPCQCRRAHGVPESSCLLRDREYSSFRQFAGYGCPSTRRQPPWIAVTIIPSAMPGPKLEVIRQLMNRRHWTSCHRKNSSNPPRRSRTVGSMKQGWSIRHRLNKLNKAHCTQKAEDVQKLAPNTHEGDSVWHLWGNWPDL